MAEKVRVQRVAEQIRGELSQILRDEVRDPRLPLLTITRVKLAVDLGAATIFYSPLGEDPDYEPDPSDCIRDRAEREGRDPYELAYDELLRNGGRAMLFFPLTDFAEHSLNPTYERLRHHGAFLSLSDGGAHCGVIADAGMPTFIMTHWGRDRTRGSRLPLEALVHKQTQATARVYGLLDRGAIVPGLRADINVIDFETLAIEPPRVWATAPTA